MEVITIDYQSYEICRLIEAIDKVTHYIDWNVECTLSEASANSTVETLNEVKAELLRRL